MVLSAFRKQAELLADAVKETSFLPPFLANQ